jgi:hypothetical protein
VKEVLSRTATLIEKIFLPFGR